MDYVHDYIVAETEEGRLAVGMVKANALWRTAHQDDSMPDAGFYAARLKPFVVKESLTRGLGALSIVRDQVIAKTASEWAREIMMANSEIDKFLMLEHL